MLTLKQIEAVYWVHTLGSFHAAAQRLNATQSTVSKRIQTLEDALGVELFDAATRTQLTIKGRELLADFERMLELQQSVISRVGAEGSYSGRFSFGVTEMVALTWLPGLIGRIQQVYPEIVLEPKVDLTTSLWPQMMSRRLDLVICPAVDALAPPFASIPLGYMDSVWMCRPGLVPATQGVVPVQTLMEHPLLVYSEGSLLHQGLLRALAAMRLRPKSTVVCNSMIALAELASAGLGVAYLPREYFSAYIRSNELCAVQTNLALPPLEYVAVHANNAISRHIAELARQQCHFGRWRRNGLGVPR
ncbi:LysR family transcriptional regulator [Bordetella trematum]|uniref:LysR family transcriptional regulator n=1 Tax=Bordetella trematum TaxID=123899 RepID=UPI001404FF03|nr:LysR family transcriptional regulator [Bordetella trematum]QIM70348.1 LysR family transcriptional regulator [Bordetella trematum]